MIKQENNIAELNMEKIKLPLEEYSQAPESPDWHKPILAKRRAELDSGQAEVLDWTDELKEEIQKEALC